MAMQPADVAVDKQAILGQLGQFGFDREEDFPPLGANAKTDPVVGVTRSAPGLQPPLPRAARDDGLPRGLMSAPGPPHPAVGADSEPDASPNEAGSSSPHSVILGSQQPVEPPASPPSQQRVGVPQQPPPPEQPPPPAPTPPPALGPPPQQQQPAQKPSQTRPPRATTIKSEVSHHEVAAADDDEDEAEEGKETWGGATPGQLGQDQQEPPSPASSAEDEKASIKEHMDSSELVLLDLIGSGAQAEVYRAIWWRSFGCATSAITVAVKRLHGNAGHRVHKCESLVRQIMHPNLVKCFEVTGKAPYFIVSEFCAGGSLYDRIHDRDKPPLTWGQRLRILVDIAKGMEYLHNCKPCILHRDLKSCNVLLTKPLTSAADHPTAKISDFGLSRLLMTDATAGMTRCVGTWRWMAPEVFSSNEYDERIDVFSFGVLMFEVLTGEIPYEDMWPLNAQVNPRIGLHIINGHRPNIRLVQNGCPTKVSQLMTDCWATSPAARPSFTDIKKQLQGQLDLVMLYSKVTRDNAF